MTKYVNKFFQKYIPENDLEKNVTKHNPAPTNIGRSKDVHDSYLADSHLSQVITKKLDVIIIPLNRNT